MDNDPNSMHVFRALVRPQLERVSENVQELIFLLEDFECAELRNVRLILKESVGALMTINRSLDSQEWGEI